MADFFSNGYGSGLIGGALGMIGGSIQYRRQKKLMAQQYEYALGMAQQNQEYAKEMAGINQGYAKEMAGINQQHNKDMFDYTGYQAQVAQMKAAGLNPALMYGSAGSGGSTQGGAGVAGGAGAGSGSVGGTPSAPDTGITAGIGMGLQLGLLDAQKKNIEADTEKKRAEAGKEEATIDNLIALTQNEKAKRGLIYSQTRLNDALEELNRTRVDEVGWNIKNIEKSIDKMESEINGTNLDNELKSRTIENQVKLVAEELKNKMADTLVKFSQNKVNNAEATAIADRIEQAWMGLGIQRGQYELDRSKLEVEADKIAKEVGIKQEHLSNEKINIIKDYILGIGNIAARIATAKK